MATSRPHPKKYVRKLELRKPCVHGETGLVLRPHQIILRPLVTEKGTHQSTRYNAYTFQVNPIATKDQIKAAVESLFPVRVEAVRIATRMAILSKFLDKEVLVIDDLALNAPRTREIAGVLKAIKIGKKTTENGEKDVTLLDTTVLIGTDKLDPSIYRSARNIDGVKVLPAAEFNCYTVLKQKRLVLTRAALDALVALGSAEKAG